MLYSYETWLFHIRGGAKVKGVWKQDPEVNIWAQEGWELWWAGNVRRSEEGRSSFKILTDKPTGKRSLGRLKCSWEDNVRMYLKEIGVRRRNCVDSPQDAPNRECWRAFVNTACNPVELVMQNGVGWTQSFMWNIQFNLICIKYILVSF